MSEEHLIRMEQFAEAIEYRAAGATDDDMAAINKFALKPLTRNDVAIFSMELCNNQVDKHYSRFPEAELAKINRMVVGRPLMQNHDLRTLPRGTFFGSQIKSVGNRMTVCPDAYIARTRGNEDFIKNLESGVYRMTSIGFMFSKPECSICGGDYRSCSHNAGERYDTPTGKSVCHYVMHNVTEVIEGSIVPAASQGTVVLGARKLPVCREDAELKRDCHGCGECKCKHEDHATEDTEDAEQKQEETIPEIRARIQSERLLDRFRMK